MYMSDSIQIPLNYDLEFTSGITRKQRGIQRASERSLMADFTEELEPLFDYSRVQPVNVVCLDDDDDEDVYYAEKKRKITETVEKVKDEVKVVAVEGCDENEDDWLPPPPKVSTDAQTMIEEDSTLRELRLKKQELLSFAQSAKSILQTVEESAKRELCNSLQPDSEVVSDKSLKPGLERVKIVISIQNKDELKQFRMYMDDNFERIFKMYADKLKLNLKQLAFAFDGDRVNPSDTPSGLGMEDEDIIEVHVKSN